MDKWVSGWEGFRGEWREGGEEEGGPCPEAEIERWVLGEVGRYDGRLAVEWVWTKI